MARGDKVIALIDNGDGPAVVFVVEATRAGRKVEVKTERGMVLVSEVTRYGDPIRTSRFMASRIVALVEDKTEEDEPARVAPPDEGLFGGDRP